MKETKEYVTNRELDITEVAIEEEKNSDLVKRIRFTTNKGDLTFSPKKKVLETSEYKGITVKRESTEGVDKKELPDKLFQISEIIDKKRVCKVKVSYHIWTREVDGGKEIYRYIQKAQFDEMQILNTPKIEEEVIE